MKLTALLSFIATVILAVIVIAKWPTLHEECNVRIYPNGIWEPVGWQIQNGHPDDCVMPYWGDFSPDGTWEPKTP